MPHRTSEHPDYIVTVDTLDPALGRRIAAEAGFAYKCRPSGLRVFLNDDPRSKQLLYESSTLELVAFGHSKRVAR